MSELDKRSKELRKSVIRMVEGDRRGHIGPALSLIEILRVLYDSFLKFDPKNPKFIDRDRFILSKGHVCLALYSILADKGFFPKEEFDNFCFIFTDNHINPTIVLLAIWEWVLLCE
jgi:transketolase